MIAAVRRIERRMVDHRFSIVYIGTPSVIVSAGGHLSRRIPINDGFRFVSANEMSKSSLISRSDD
ncbi:hypothetical protein ACIPVB_07870 [Microbacterium sp. NPDC090007]|uniref:hypothetical protein n=1 Tax=Microbacterium sp. NPDC090007 TaxID=3364204 RepID=UPI0038286F77